MNLHQLAGSLRALASYSLGPTTTCNSLHGGDRADTLSQQVSCACTARMPMMLGVHLAMAFGIAAISMCDIFVAPNGSDTVIDNIGGM